MKQLQVGIIGSMDDNLNPDFKKVASDLGREMANRGISLVYGFEGDHDSFSTIAAKAAIKEGGQVVAFTWGRPNKDNKDSGSVVINTGQLRGGGREFSLILSCDGLISIGGGAGTLTEMVIAYQFGIPTVAIKGTGGWSDKIVGRDLDGRKRQKVLGASSFSEALDLLVKTIRS